MFYRCVAASSAVAFLVAWMGNALMGLAACEKDCHEFEWAVANVTPPGHGAGAYCLGFGDASRGGEIYAFGTGFPNKGMASLDFCTVYHESDCSSTCTPFNPRVTAAPNPPAERLFGISTMSVYRYPCLADDGNLEL